MTSDPADGSRSRESLFRRVSEGAWRLLGVGLVTLALAGLTWKLRFVVLPILIALLLCAVLTPLVVRLEARGWKSTRATLLVFFGFLFTVGGSLAAIVPPTIGELEGLGDTIEVALDDIEDWLVDGPLHLDRSDVEEVTNDPGGRLAELARDSSERLVDSARLVGETLAGALLALILTFLFLKDGRRFQRWALAHLPPRHHEVVSAAGQRAFGAFGGFVRGAATLGVVEGITIGTAVWLVGAPLAMPVALVTFLAAFFPIVGAILAGAMAVLVVLATQGLTAAIIVLVVAVVVQQLDNDLLAPWIYGRSLQLHPAMILVVLTAGGFLGGIAGAFVAVPVSGAVSAVASELWGRYGSTWVDGVGPAGEGDPGGGSGDDPTDDDAPAPPALPR